MLFEDMPYLTREAREDYKLEMNDVYSGNGR